MSSDAAGIKTCCMSAHEKHITPDPTRSYECSGSERCRLDRGLCSCADPHHTRVTRYPCNGRSPREVSKAAVQIAATALARSRPGYGSQARSRREELQGLGPAAR